MPTVADYADRLRQMGAAAPLPTVDTYTPPQLDIATPTFEAPTVVTADQLAALAPPVPAPRRTIDLGMGPNVPPVTVFGKPTAHGLLANVASNAAVVQKAFPGLRMTSGYRDPEHNAAVGGVKNSYHTRGRAVDFVGSAKDMHAAQALARQMGAREALIHNAGSGVHLHLAW